MSSSKSASTKRHLNRVGSVLLGAGLLVSSACQTKTAPSSVAPATSDAAHPSAAAAPCNCDTQFREIRELTRSAQKKIAHHDASCMDDLNRIRKLDASPGAAQGGMDAALGYMRAQCEMVSGHCNAGRARIVKLMREGQAMGPEMADSAADGYVAMYCRSSQANDRDRLLAAMYDLQDGAHMNRKSADFCQARIEIVQELLPRVHAKGPDDHRIESARRSIFYTASKCLARAGDCAGSWAAYQQLTPRDQLDTVPAAQQREAMRMSFDSLVPECKH